MVAMLSHESAVALLERSLQMGGSKPSTGLISIFEAAAMIAAERAPRRSLISTRLLVFGLGYVGVINVPSLHEGDVETRAIMAAARLFVRNPTAFEQQSEDYFDSGNDDDRSPSPDLSRNVHRLLQDLAKIAGAKGVPVVTAVDFLLGFPPAKGLARRLLDNLGTGPAELHEAVHAILDSEPEGGGSERKARDEIPEAEQAARNEWVTTHRDEPAEADQLGRLAFAQVLADRIGEARRTSDEDKDPQEKTARKPTSFMVHLHGPWGSGKSSVLNFLEAELRESGQNWIVVTFNAWRDQRLQPPWWALITAIYAGAQSTLKAEKDLIGRWRLRARWFAWRLRADFLPIAAVLMCLIVIAMLIRLGAVGDADAAFALVAGAITLAGAVFLGSRSLALGSQRAAQTYVDLKGDPYKPITSLFTELMGTINRPVAVFIDDLDRCEAKYVVDLLEGIQTLMRDGAVTYVVAADRKWICSSFEQRYRDFTPPIGEPGRPLGYLFLDKLFQISAALPQLADDQKTAYWRSLLKDEEREKKQGGESDAPSELPQPADPAQALLDARRDVDTMTTQEELRTFVTRAEETGDEIRIQAARAAAARRIASPDVARDTEHRLRRFSTLIEANPRAMKRLVNAYGMHQAALFLAGREIEVGALARWTIVELRWPLLADFLAARPACVDNIGSKLAEGDMPDVVREVRELFGDELVTGVVALDQVDGLTSEAITSILGVAHRER